MTNEEVLDALKTLMALERDRQFGYHTSELHTDPTGALRDAMGAVESAGDDPDQIIWPEDQKKLGL